MDKILKMNTRMQTSIMILFGALVFAMKLTNVNVEEFLKENQLIAVLIIVFVVTSMLNLVITTVLLLKIRRKKKENEKTQNVKVESTHISKPLIIVLFLITIIEYVAILYGVYFIVDAMMLSDLWEIHNLIGM